MTLRGRTSTENALHAIMRRDCEWYYTFLGSPLRFLGSAIERHASYLFQSRHAISLIKIFHVKSTYWLHPNRRMEEKSFQIRLSERERTWNRPRTLTLVVNRGSHDSSYGGKKSERRRKSEKLPVKRLTFTFAPFVLSIRQLFVSTFFHRKRRLFSLIFCWRVPYALVLDRNIFCSFWAAKRDARTTTSRLSRSFGDVNHLIITKTFLRYALARSLAARLVNNFRSRDSPKLKDEKPSRRSQCTKSLRFSHATSASLSCRECQRDLLTPQSIPLRSRIRNPFQPGDGDSLTLELELGASRNSWKQDKWRNSRITRFLLGWWPPINHAEEEECERALDSMKIECGTSFHVLLSSEIACLLIVFACRHWKIFHFRSPDLFFGCDSVIWDRFQSARFPPNNDRESLTVWVPPRMPHEHTLHCKRLNSNSFSNGHVAAHSFILGAEFLLIENGDWNAAQMKNSSTEIMFLNCIRRCLHFISNTNQLSFVFLWAVT